MHHLNKKERKKRKTEGERQKDRREIQGQQQGALSMLVCSFLSRIGAWSYVERNRVHETSKREEKRCDVMGDEEGARWARMSGIKN